MFNIRDLRHCLQPIGNGWSTRISADRRKASHALVAVACTLELRSEAHRHQTAVQTLGLFYLRIAAALFLDLANQVATSSGLSREALGFEPSSAQTSEFPFAIIS